MSEFFDIVGRQEGKPMVSIVVPNFNHARFLGKRIASIYSQTFQDWELILLDDASTDDSMDVLRRYIDDHRVTHEFNSANSGSPFKQWELGVRKARGNYVWIAESDDIADPRLLEELVALLNANPEAALAYCQSRKIDEDDNDIGSMVDLTRKLSPDKWSADFVEDGRDECISSLLWMNTIPNASGVVFRRHLFPFELMPKLSQFRINGDWLVWAAILMKGDVVYCAKELNQFRFHSGSVRTTTAKEKAIHERTILRHYILTNCPMAGIPKRMNCLIDRMRMLEDTIGDLNVRLETMIFEYEKLVHMHKNSIAGRLTVAIKRLIPWRR